MWDHLRGPQPLVTNGSTASGSVRPKGVGDRGLCTNLPARPPRTREIPPLLALQPAVACGTSRVLEVTAQSPTVFPVPVTNSA